MGRRRQSHEAFQGRCTVLEEEEKVTNVCIEKLVWPLKPPSVEKEVRTKQHVKPKTVKINYLTNFQYWLSLLCQRYLQFLFVSYRWDPESHLILSLLEKHSSKIKTDALIAAEWRTWATSALRWSALRCQVFHLRPIALLLNVHYAWAIHTLSCTLINYGTSASKGIGCSLIGMGATFTLMTVSKLIEWVFTSF